MGHERSEYKQGLGPPGATVARALALLLIVCLVECASEQRNTNRGSKTPNLVEKPYGWRSQRGGSCLSYGHSCWGAHGKRSGQDPMTLPKGSDWYLMRLLRRMSLDLPQARQPQLNDNSDLSDIYRVGISEENSDGAISTVDSEEVMPFGVKQRRHPDAIPMIDEDTLTKYKLMQLMRSSSINK